MSEEKSQPGKPVEETLATLRCTIDSLDKSLHDLLMERSEVIEALIAAKGTRTSGQAFRPAREAQMMQALAARHHGLLPLTTVEGIWRVMIASFTWLQAPFTVHAAGGTEGGTDLDVLRDSVRFHFGFTPPLVMQQSPEEVIAAVQASRGDLGILAITSEVRTPWWQALEPKDAPKIIARLPFLERKDHPAGVPVFVIARPLDSGTEALDVRLYSSLHPAGTVISRTREGRALVVLSDGEAGTMPLCIGGHAAPLSLMGE
jgi:chorismate mutase